MRYPTGKDSQDFKSNWYNAQGFAMKTSYGYHEGDDLNLKTGGNSDLGQPLYAVADGKIVYYHNASHPTTGFGRHMVLRCETSRGTRWYHYAHCQEITAQVKEVKEGDVIGKLGNSGTTAAHLHFAVFKKDPSTLYKGIDSIAHNMTELHNTWEEFELLSTQEQMPEKKYTEAEMSAMREERDKNWNYYQEEKADHEATKAKLKECKDSHSRYVETVATKLGTIADEAETIGGIERLVTVEDQFNDKSKAYNKLEKKMALLESDKNLEISKLKAEIKELQKVNEKQGVEIEKQATHIQRLSERIEELGEIDQHQPTHKKTILDYLIGLLSIFGRKS